jgi:hypothetical protein
VPQKRNKQIVVPFTVDLISDLNLTPVDGFDWDGKATSLFCIVAGNLSSDLAVIRDSLEILGKYYRGVFYIDGNTEHPNLIDYEHRIKQIKKICSESTNAVYLHNHVVILNNVAFVAINGWMGNRDSDIPLEHSLMESYHNHDIAYLMHTVKTLQLHKEVNSMVVISNSLPSKQLTNDDPSIHIQDTIEPVLSLLSDTEKKVNCWMFGSYQNLVDTEINGRRYVNNPHIISGVYSPKRIEV